MSTKTQRRTRFINIQRYYMAESASWQDEANPAFWLASQAGKNSPVSPARKSPLFDHIINPLLTKLVRSRWLYIGLVRFGVFIDLDNVSVSKNAKYNWLIYSHINLTLCQRRISILRKQGFVLWQRAIFHVLADQAENPERARYTSRPNLCVCYGPKRKRHLGSLDERTKFDLTFFRGF